jgi:hypothetical protein
MDIGRLAWWSIHADDMGNLSASGQSNQGLATRGDLAAAIVCLKRLIGPSSPDHAGSRQNPEVLLRGQGRIAVQQAGKGRARLPCQKK